MIRRRAALCGAAAAFLPLVGLTAEARPLIERAWLGPAERMHGHDALGVGRYPGRLHAVVRHGGRRHEAEFELSAGMAFEDGLVRLADLDADGSPELVLVRADAEEGASVVVLAAEIADGMPKLVQRARGPSVGAGRWLNPIGTADFDGDGRQEVVAVLTPHIGGVLTLYRYEPPHLVPVAQERNVSNHWYGDAQQQLAAIVLREGRRVVAVPDQSRRRVRLLAPARGGRWEAVAPELAFEQPIRGLRVVDGQALEIEAGGRKIMRLP